MSDAQITTREDAGLRAALAESRDATRAALDRAGVPQDPPDRAWYKSRKFIIVTGGFLSLFAPSTVAMFMGKAAFGEWSTMSLTLFGLAMGLYGIANVASQFAMARAQK